MKELTVPHADMVGRETPKPEVSSRRVSLDVFRGLTIAGMVLVNNPGSWANIYWPLRHAEWNGWTPTDLIFPFFVFIVGVAMAFSFRSRLDRGESRAHLLKHVVWRGIALFAIGMFLNGFPNHYQLDHRSEEHTSELQSQSNLVCRLLLE